MKEKSSHSQSLKNFFPMHCFLKAARGCAPPKSGSKPIGRQKLLELRRPTQDGEGKPQMMGKGDAGGETGTSGRKQPVKAEVCWRALGEVLCNNH